MADWMSRLIVVSVFICILCTACSPTTKSVEKHFEADKATNDIASLVDRYSAPGLAVAVISDGEIVYAQGFGYRDLSTKSPVNSQTQFGIGSVVKTFTSGLIGSLEADNLVELNIHPAHYVPELLLKGVDLTENLKLESLLSQTSGLPNIDGSYVFFPVATQVDLAPRFKHFEASCRVGDCWIYNNMNFTTLDMVAESVSDQSKSELLLERLLRPIGMRDTVSSTRAFLASSNAAIAYGMRDGKAIPVAYETFYGEHIYATAPDMARWLGMWMNDGVVGEQEVIPSSFIKKATSMQAIEDGSPPQINDPHVYLFGYGYGWQVKSVEGHYLVHHGGNENGFSTHVMFAPASKIGVVAMTNQQNSILPNLVTDMMIRRLLELPPTEAADYPVVVSDITPPISQSDAKLYLTPNDPMTVNLSNITGTYEAPGYGQMKVDYSDNQLSLETPLANFILIHEGGNKFGIRSTESVSAGINISYFQIEFIGGKTGALTINLEEEPVVFSKVN